VVMLIGARLNWLLSHGKGKTWGDAPKKFIQIDIEPKEMDSNVEISAPVVGDIGSCVSALLAGMGANWAAPPSDWTGAVTKKREENVAKMAPRLMNNNSPMDYHGALGVLRTIIKERPDAILVNEGANTLDLARGQLAREDVMETAPAAPRSLRSEGPRRWQRSRSRDPGRDDRDRGRLPRRPAPLPDRSAGASSV